MAQCVWGRLHCIFCSISLSILSISRVFIHWIFIQLETRELNVLCFSCIIISTTLISLHAKFERRNTIEITCVLEICFNINFLPFIYVLLFHMYFRANLCYLSKDGIFSDELQVQFNEGHWIHPVIILQNFRMDDSHNTHRLLLIENNSLHAFEKCWIYKEYISY